MPGVLALAADIMMVVVGNTPLLNRVLVIWAAVFRAASKFGGNLVGQLL